MKNDRQDSSDIRYSKSAFTKASAGKCQLSIYISAKERKKDCGKAPPSKCIQMRIYFMLMHDALRRKILCWSWKKCTRNLAQSMALLPCFEAHFHFWFKKGGQSQQWKITTMSLISIQPGWSFFIMCVYAQVNTFFIIGSVTTYTYKRKNQDILEKLDASSSHNKQPCVRITFPKATI